MENINIKITRADDVAPKMESIDDLVSFLDSVNAQIGQGFTSGIIGSYSWELNYEKTGN